MRALFAEEDAYVFTTWSGGVPIDEFIKISQIGFSKGVKIAVRLLSSPSASFADSFFRRSIELMDVLSMSLPQDPLQASEDSES